MPATKQKRSDRIQELRSELKEARANWQSVVRGIQDDHRYSDEFKRELIDAERSKHAHHAKATAREAWRKAQKVRGELDAELGKLSQEDQFDYSRLDFLTREIENQLVGPRRDVLGNDGRLATIADLLERAQLSGDKHQLRALRTAAAPVLQELRRDVHSDNGSRAKALARDLEDASQSEFDRLRSERQMLDNHHLQRLESDILETESAVTGAKHGAFATLSEWQRDIFGISNESTGRVVPPSGPAEPNESEG